VLRLAGGVVLLAVGAGLAAILGAYAGAAVVALAVAVVLVLRIPGLRALESGAAAAQSGRLLRFSLPLVFGGVLFDFAELVDVLMIGLYRDESQVGIYAVGSALARGLLLLVSSTMPAVATLAAEAAGRSSGSDVARLHRTVARWMLLFTGPLAVGLLLFPGEAVTILFGRAYAGAAPTVRILVLAYLGGILAGPVGVFVNALGKTHWTLGNMLLRTVVNVVANLILIPCYGIAGAALGTLLALWMAQGLLLAMLGRLAPIRGSYSGWGRPVIVLAVSAAAGWGVSRLVLTAGLGGARSDWTAALIGGAVLLGTFALGVRRIPGCLEKGDLALLDFVRARGGRGPGA
jgi:O-antigen/teichoic acid export membrane protein